MLEGPGDRRRLNRLQRTSRRQSRHKLSHLRAQAVGLAAFGVMIGAGGFVALEQGQPRVMAISQSFYASCREAIQDGAAPIYRGQTGYREYLDADNDGIACEAYRPR